jgi:hypothetical protein
MPSKYNEVIEALERGKDGNLSYTVADKALTHLQELKEATPEFLLESLKKEHAYSPNIKILDKPITTRDIVINGAKALMDFTGEQE